MTLEFYDRVFINRADAQIREASGEAADLGTSDPKEALLKLDDVAMILEQWRALLVRREEQRLNEQAREEMETAIPPYGFSA